jgi:O-methyltransferase
MTFFFPSERGPRAQNFRRSRWDLQHQYARGAHAHRESRCPGFTSGNEKEFWAPGPQVARVGDALGEFAKEAGEFDVVYCDVDKDGYPDCWRAARDRIRVGGLWLCDNTIWSGRVAIDQEGATAIPLSSGSTTGWWPRTPGMWAASCRSGTA